MLLRLHRAEKEHELMIRSSMCTALVVGGLLLATWSASGMRGAAQTSKPAIVPFTIHVPDDVLSDLKQRLARTRFTDEIENSDWRYGVKLSYLKELVAYWRD